MATRILIADDDSTIRRLLRRIVEEHVEWSVCAEAVDGIDAIGKVADCPPDVVIMDLAMPRMNGLEAARQISKASPGLPMLLLTVQEVSVQLIQEARTAGTCSGSPRPVRLKVSLTYAATPEKERLRSRTISKRRHVSTPRSTGLPFFWAEISTSCSGFAYGSGRRRSASITLKMALFAPIPSASVSTATAVNRRAIVNWRIA